MPHGGALSGDNQAEQELMMVVFQSPMEIALEEARCAFDADEVPVGAVVFSSEGKLLARARNRMRSCSDPTAHAEIIAIREAAGNLGSERLMGCDLYVTLEPCAMCAAAISFARIRRLYFGASDQKQGGVEHGPRFFTSATCHHAPEVYGGLSERPALELMRQFFILKRV